MIVKHILILTITLATSLLIGMENKENQPTPPQKPKHTVVIHYAPKSTPSKEELLKKLAETRKAVSAQIQAAQHGGYHD